MLRTSFKAYTHTLFLIIIPHTIMTYSIVRKKMGWIAHYYIIYINVYLKEMFCVASSGKFRFRFKVWNFKIF